MVSRRHSDLPVRRFSGFLPEERLDLVPLDELLELKLDTDGPGFDYFD